MSQRNPRNERYMQDGKRAGKSRKSAASVKPKSNAASSVRTAPKKTKAQQKEAKSNKRQQEREQRQKQQSRERRYGNPPTKKFKRLRIIWFVLIGLAILCVSLAFAASQMDILPENAGFMFTVLAWLFLIAFIVLDMMFIRKEKRRYYERMDSMNTKEQRAEEKVRKAALREEKKEAERRQKEPDYEDATEKTMMEKVKSFFVVDRKN